MPDFCDNKKANIILFCIGAAGFVLLALGTNLAGLCLSYRSDEMIRWLNNSHPFIISMAIAMVNLFRQLSFHSRAVNYISSLSLLIYIIHENLILRTYFRPKLWMYVYSRFGNDHVVLWVFIITVIVFTFGLLCAIIYDKTLRRIIKKISEKLFRICSNIYGKIEKNCWR